ncbi:MAG: T9SS type A sorting domain-containing protein [Ignavibacteria bacterium]|nr:T9SS type A sorting domain-containing protein [Ignavibacteria bacterium]
MKLFTAVTTALLFWGAMSSVQSQTVQLLSPGGSPNESYRAGNSVDLVYQTSPSTVTPRPRYRFEFSTSPNGPWTSISGATNVVDSNASGTVRAGRFIGAFRIPATPTNTGYVRQVLLSDPSKTSISPFPFKIEQPQTTRIDEFLQGAVGAGETRTLTRDKVYGIKGYFHVDNGGTLVIEPGTIVVGDQVGVNSALVINRGGKIIADGRADAPIVLTSSAPPGLRAPGDWGGLLIFGKAVINNPGGEAAMEGGVADPNNKSRWYYGGNDDNDNSGILRYVRIEFGGIALQPNQELNGLTLGAVGRGTIMEKVQVSYANDDAYEWFGGTVNGKYLISTSCLDDDFDADNGWSGKVQYAVAQRSTNRADQSTSQAFETDNDASGSFRIPRTSGIFSNVTVIGPLQDVSATPNPRFGAAALIRRASLLSIYNSIFLGWPRGIEIAQTPTMNAAYNDTVQVRNCAWYGIKTSWLNLAGGTPPSGMTTSWISTGRFNNVNDASNNPSAALLENPFSDIAFSAVPLAGSPVLSGASFVRDGVPAIDDSFFDKVSFRGAFGSDMRWDYGWANYDPVNAAYIAGAPTVAGASLRLTAPSTGRVYVAGTTATIEWDTTGTRGLRYKFQTATSIDGPWTDIQGAESITDEGSTRGRIVNGYKVPSTPSTNAYIRMVALRNDGSINTDASSILGPLTIVSYTLTSPKGGEVYRAGSRQLLAWKQEPQGELIGTVKLRFEYATSNSGPWTPIPGAEMVEDNDDKVLQGGLVLPLTQTETAFVRMTVLNEDGSPTSISSTNAQPFKVIGIRLLSPASAASLKGGSKVDIMWDTTATAGSRFRFQYRLNDTEQWNDIQGATNVLDAGANRGKIVGGFTVPNVATTNGYVRMTALAENGNPIEALSSQNEQPFTITVDKPVDGIVRIITPGAAAGERYRPGRSLDITYDTVGGYRRRYRFEYGTSANGPWTVIKGLENIIDSNRSSTLRRGRITGGFLVPDQLTKTAYLRMVLLSDESKVDITDNPIEIFRPTASKVDSVLSGSINKRVFLSNTKIYGLRGYVHVDNGGVLVIQPGTIILGDSVGKNCALVVNRGGKIIAKGTAKLPIVFSSLAAPGQRESGDWGGLLIFGKAVINNPGGEAAMEGGVADPNNKSRWYYGGNDDNDSSGILEYVRIEFAGLALQPNQELNGLTMGGVGRKTVMNNIQISYANDDSFEWFGGTVNAKNIISIGALDDDFDGDNGWSGKVQFAIAQRHPNRADQSTSQAMEMDNDASGSTRKPLTSPIFSNMTVIGPINDTSKVPNPRYGAAIQIRRNARTSVFNSAILGWGRGMEIAQTTTMNAAKNDSLQFRNNAMFGIRSTLLNLAGGTPPTGMTTEWINTPAFNNTMDKSSPQKAGLQNPFEIVEFNPAAMESSPLLSGANFTNSGIIAIDDAYFEKVQFRGAMGLQRWDAEWTEYDPINAEYKAQQAPVSVNENSINTSDIVASVYPNPTHDKCIVKYQTRKDGMVKAQFVNAMGDIVSTFFAEQQQAGFYQFNINVQDMPTGLYFVRIESDNNTMTIPVSVYK